MDIILTLAFVLGGAALTYLYDRRAGLLARLAAGVCTGMAAWGFLGYILASLFGLTPATCSVAALPLLTPLALFAFRGPRAHLRRDVADLFHGRRLPRRWFLVLTLALFTALMVYLLVITFYERDGELFTDNHFNLGDLPFHLSVLQGFAVGRNFPPQHPEFAGAKLTYPFLVDFVPAQYAVCGSSLTQAITLQNVLLALSLPILLFRWAMAVTRRRVAALTVLPLFFFSGGAGILLLFIRDIPHALNGPGQLLFHLPHDYTRGSDDILSWGNPITTLLMTQRGMLFALPMALLALTLLQQRGRTRLFAAGCVTGMIPLLHGHTFLALLLIGGVGAALDLRLWRRLREWLYFFVPAFILAAPQIVVLANGSAVKPGTFFGWQPGWDVGNHNPLLFWLWNLGLFLPLLMVAFFINRAKNRPLMDSRLRFYYLPFPLLFLLPNLFRFAPWVWDNIKILIYFFLGSAPLVALLIALLWSAERRPLLGKIAAMTLLFLLCISGAVDVWRIGSRQQTQRLFDKDALAFADLLRRETPPGARILHAPYYAHPALLAGRRLMLGYEGHLWSHGLDFNRRLEDMKRIYAGDPATDSLLHQYGIQYILVGPPERNQQGYHLNEPFFQRYRLIGEAGEYRLLGVQY